MAAPYRPSRAIACGGCTILIGPGYLSTVAWPAPDGEGVLCGPCAVALQRAARRGEDPLRRLRIWRGELAAESAPRDPIIVRRSCG